MCAQKSTTQRTAQLADSSIIFTMKRFWLALMAAAVCLLHETSGQSGSGGGTVTPEPMIYVGFEQTAYTFSESELEASNEVCVVVSEASPGVSAVVEVTLRQDTALAGVDFTVVNNSQLAVSGQSVRGCVDITVVNDVLPEGSETLQALLSLISVSVNGSSLDPSNIVFTNDQTNITIVDSEGFIEVPMSRTALLNSGVVSFVCSSSLNYQAFAISWLINGQQVNSELFPPGVSVTTMTGMNSGLSSSLTIPTSLDFNNADVVCILLSEITSVSDPAVLTLQFATVEFESESYIVSESAPTLTPNIVVLDSTLLPSVNITVNVSTSPGSAVGGADFIPSVERITLSNVMPGNLIPFTIRIINDDDIDPGESFSLVLTPSSPGVFINVSIATVTIMNDDEFVGIGFDPVVYNVSESGSAMLRVTLNTTTDRVITVNMVTLSATAIAPGDYQTLNLTLTFVNSTELFISVSTTADEVTENREYFTAQLINATPSHVTVITTPNATVNIIDQQVAVVRFSANEYSVSEDDRFVQIGVQLLTLTERTIVTTVSVIPGTAQTPEDYTGPETVPVTLDFESYQVFVLVNIVNDNILDGTKFFYATLSTESERVSITQNQTRVVIFDNDVVYVRFNPVEYSVAENDGVVTLTVEKIGASGIPVNVTVTTQDINATVRVDYEFLSQEVSFPPSLEQQSSLDFNVSIVDDSNVTGSVSQFEVYLNSTQDGVLIQMDNSTAIVNIIDDDRVRIEVGFQKTGYAVSESDGSVAIVVIVNGNLTTPFDVQITGTNGTASSLNYYEVQQSTLTISPGTSLYQVDVAIIDNSIVEPRGYQNFSLQLSTSESSVMFTNGTTVITIYDNDFSSPLVSTAGPFAIVIDGQPVNFTCNITTPLLSVDVTWLDGNGEVLSNSSYTRTGYGVTEDRVGSSIVAMLMVSSFPLSDYIQQGGFSCVARVGHLFMELATTATTPPVTGQLASPSVAVSFLPFSTRNITIGQNITVVCAIATDYGRPTDIAVTPRIFWDIISYEDADEVVMETFEDTQLINITTAVFLSELHYNPILTMRSFTCRSYVEPSSTNLIVRQSDNNTDTRLLNPEVPDLSVSINPAPVIIIADIPPYNNYTLTCNATIPRDLVHLPTIFNINGFPSLLTFSANYTPAQDCETVMFTNDRLCSYSVMVTESSNVTESPQRFCSVELTFFDRERQETISVTRQGTDVLLLVNVPNLPAPVANYHVFGTSSRVAIFHWIVPRITYTPERYYIQYRARGEDSNSETFTSPIVEGTSNFTARNVEYDIVLDGLSSGTSYTANIVANNTFGSQSSTDIPFATSPLDIYRVVSDIDDTIPIGAPLDIDFRFNGEGLTSISESTQLTFYPLFHDPVIEPSNIFYDGELRQVTVSYNHVSPSLTGDYVLCQEATPPPSARRKRGVEPPESRSRTCGGRVTITVIVPTLTISTNLLIEQYLDGSYVGGAQSPSVTCLPSDSRAPVRWRAMFGSVDYLVSFSPLGLNHTLNFPASYEQTPTRTETFICDLINVELSGDVAVSPQTVTVRFIQAEVAILNDDFELPPSAVINQFSSFFPELQPGLSLRCLSVVGHPNLQWMSREVSGLPDGPISSPEVDIAYFPESDAQQRDVVLTVRPITERLVGSYSCVSQESGVSADVYVTMTNPLWELITPTVNYLPIGTLLPVVSARYADFSTGYRNNGPGFSYSLTFEHYSLIPEAPLSSNGTGSERDGSDFSPMEPLSDHDRPRTLVTGRTSALVGNNVTYLITGELSVFDGQYQLNATRVRSGQAYSDTITLRVFVPYFSQADQFVLSRIGDLVTLSCIPNDTVATVYWIRRMNALDQTVLMNSDSDFNLSPPQRNHRLTFNATNIVARSLGDFTTLRGEIFTVICAFVNGGNTSDIFAPVNITVQLQEERIRVVTLPQQTVIQNNTVINRFSSSDMLGSGIAEGVPDPDFMSVGELTVDCRTAQGDHDPVWSSDSLAVNNTSGLVNTNNGVSSQFTANYTARLQLNQVSAQTEGNYFCRSQQSNLFTTFLVSTDNPYVRAVSPSNLVVTEGDSVTLIFQIAVDSDGATWTNNGVSFSFTNRFSEIQTSLDSSFTNSRVDFPHYFVYTIKRVGLSNAGLYQASAPRRDCGPDTSVCGFTSASIDMTVRTYCPEEVMGGILWPRTISLTEVSLPCSQAGPLFRQGTFTTRSCSEIGAWSDVDLSTCTLVRNASPFLLVSFVLETEDQPQNVEDLIESSQLENEMENLLTTRGIQFVDVTLNSAYISSISVTFQITLPFNINQNLALLNFVTYFSRPFTMFGNFTVRKGDRSLTQVTAVDSCPCRPLTGSSMEPGLEFSTDSNYATFELCSGVSISPCNCTLDTCQCLAPFVGDGVRCTLDSDGDLYPDVALLSPVCNTTEGRQEIYCIQDNCPMVINVDQDQFACQTDTSVVNPTFDGCPYEVDDVWDITWPNTQRNTTDAQLCPGGHDAQGIAMRYCNSDGIWEEANVLECTTVQFIDLEQLAQETIATLDPEEQLVQSAELTQQLIEATQPQNRSLLPNDLQASTRILTTVLQVLEDNDNATTDLSVIDIFDNMLDPSQMDGWRTLQMVGLRNGSEMLLNNAERYGLLVASSANRSSSDEAGVVRQSRQNIVVTGNQYRDPPPSTMLRFPIGADLVNYTKRNRDFSEINIPPSLIQERMDEMDDNGTLPVFFLLIRDLPMGVFLSNASTIPATTCTTEGTQTTMAATDVVAAQVGTGNSKPGSSQSLQNDPVFLNFSANSFESASLYRCVYWNFSQPVGNGSWVIAGVTTTDVTASGNQTVIQCLSTHLTSFAVLVDVAGGLEDIGDAERTALQIVSYIGCAISIICLTATVIFFLFQGKKLKTSAHFFVHLNLALTLLLAFVVFAIGVETAIGSTGGCAFVAALLHYLFLSAFCWMLCEGIMLYLLLIVVFSKMSKKWWPFLLIGYVPPLPIVIITVAVRYPYYGVRDNCGDLLYCWLSVERGTIFGFVAPMLAIILINTVFLVMALYTLFKTKKKQFERKQDKDDSRANRQTAKAIFTASVVLLPLLGLTWMFGILTVNANSTAFAWLFTIFNSLQGAFIFIFHVVRSDPVWSKVSPRLKTLRRSTFRTTAKWYDMSSGGRSTISKGGTMRSTSGQFGTLSRDPNSTLGRGDTYKKKDLPLSQSTSETSVQSPSFYELKSDLSPVSEASESVAETETKVDLSLVEKGVDVGNDAAKDSTIENTTSTKEETTKESEDDRHEITEESDKERLVSSSTSAATPKQEKSEVKEVEKETSDAEVIVNPSTEAGTPKMNKTEIDSAKVDTKKSEDKIEQDASEKETIESPRGTKNDDQDKIEETKTESTEPLASPSDTQSNSDMVDNETTKL